jgi:adenine-specific DNA methylase
MTSRKKLIEVALPLEAINKASAREKSIRHGHPSTLHLWACGSKLYFLFILQQIVS